MEPGDVATYIGDFRPSSTYVADEKAGNRLRNGTAWLERDSPLLVVSCVEATHRCGNFCYLYVVTETTVGWLTDENAILGG
jgi:hypothetical protein